MHDPKSQEQTQQAEVDCRWPRLNRVLKAIRRHAIEIGAVCAILMLIATIVATIVLPVIWGPPSAQGPATPQHAGPLTFVSQVKRTGMPTWSSSVEIPDVGGSIALGMRIENTGSQTLTGLVARAAVPGAFGLGDRCEYGLSNPAETPCAGAIVGEEGVELPDLEPGNWILLIFVAAVPPEVPGGRYSVPMRVITDQTGEREVTSEVIVPATNAEEAVRSLFLQTEAEDKFWEGIPEMALRAKRFLIEAWSKLNLGRVHPFAELPGGRSATLDDLFYEQHRAGQVAVVRARVVGRPRDLFGSGRAVKQSYEAMAEGEDARLHCYTPRPVDDLLTAGQELEIKAVPIAWSPPGSAKRLTMALCPAVRHLGPRGTGAGGELDGEEHFRFLVLGSGEDEHRAFQRISGGLSSRIGGMRG